jgi:ribonucleoside-diphosphate reductase alpha chain
MGVLRVDHPDILEFIQAKTDQKTLQNFNVSVGVTDAFMQALDQGGRFNLIHPRTGQTAGQLDAREVFQAVVQAAWRTGDPGLLFLDTINRGNPTPHLGAIEATNPCGEIPLLPYEACNLGSINLARLLLERDGRASVHWEKLRELVPKAVRFLDNVIEVTKYPVPEIAQATRGNRKIGLGVMGFAEMLIRLDVSYDSEAALHVAEQVMRFIAAETRAASQALAKERGVFPHWKGSVYEAQGLPLRNATCTAIAPTGTIGIIANTSPSIEPLFALAYRRSHVLGGQTLTDVNPLLLEQLSRSGLDAQRLVEQILAKGSLQNIPGVPDELRRLFVTALEIPVERHLQIQAAFQRHVDNSVSKTINLPGDATPADVASAYRRAWELGLKGITIYRYGSKTTQVLELGTGETPHQYDHASRCDPGECRL